MEPELIEFLKSIDSAFETFLIIYLIKIFLDWIKYNGTHH
jgi:hypothetical protein